MKWVMTLTRIVSQCSARLPSGLRFQLLCSADQEHHCISSMPSLAISVLAQAHPLIRCSLDEARYFCGFYSHLRMTYIAKREIGMAIELFKHMKSCGMLPNDATYNIMIDLII
ncbi:hypothetical protein F8388_015256 [Cannabis sativa]|uniref:Pentatricopeptide repeat-containing protein n=1 Tax=Cannabis sativa TaxID=3483 RepID=A0A7J6HJT1_CANSA|nr:hypothetical protein F8388_015256 [Cannabis sativa]KAF4395514.1 hypothetical protein G4B88_010978 [Cannabis sativa]